MTGALVLADPDGAARRTRIARELGEALAKLAIHGTPTQIAVQLLAAGHRGSAGNAKACPIHAYLAAALDVAPAHLSVGRHDCGLAGPEQDERAQTRMPEAVGAFVRRFDSGFYPQLDTNPHPLRRVP